MAGGVAVLAIGSVTALIAFGGEDSTVKGPFGQNYEGLDARRDAVNVPWGVAFSQGRLGPHRATANKTVRMWVDGKPSDAFGRLQLRDGQRIVVSYGPKNAPAPGGIDR